MGKRLTDVLKGSAAAGLFAGLAALTGLDLDPESLLVGVCDLAAGWLQGMASGDVMVLLGDLKLAILIHGLIGTALLIWSILYCGWRGVIVAACGYFGMVILVTGIIRDTGSVLTGLVLLAVAVACAALMRDHAGRDLRRVMKAAGLPVKRRR
jgi:hypothetical protein